MSAGERPSVIVVYLRKIYFRTVCTPSGSLELREDRLRVDALLLAERVERAAHIGAALLRLPELREYWIGLCHLLQCGDGIARGLIGFVETNGPADVRTARRCCCRCGACLRV